jgi:tetratricopeptide (TPR) repeat protein/transcriptional regulator with XRE-family HTH domain
VVRRGGVPPFAATGRFRARNNRHNGERVIGTMAGSAGNGVIHRISPTFVACPLFAERHRMRRVESRSISGETRAFGLTLTRLRRAAELTQEELAERCKLSVRGIGYLERGARHPRRSTVDLLVDGLGLAGPERSELLAAAEQAGCQPARPAELVGRRAELDVIGAHVAGAGSPVLVLTGEAGIGKSRLLAEAARAARERGMTVLSAGCHRFGGEPYSPVSDALADYARTASEPSLRGQLEGCAGLARLVPELRGLVPEGDGPADTRGPLFAAAGRFLGAVAGRHGVLLLLDDLHWAGPDGVMLLSTVIRAVGPRRLRVVAAYRETEARSAGPLSAFVGDLVRLDLVSRLPLPPLSEQDARTLLGQVTGAVDAGIRDRVLRLSCGLPLFLVKLGHALAESGGVMDQLPWGLTHAVRQQLGALPPLTADLLTVLAVNERRLDLPQLAAASGVDEDALLAALEPARTARLLDENADGFQLTHHLVAEVINTDLSPSQRHAVHRRLAEALRTSRPSAVLAYHYAQAEDPERAAVTLRQAADDAVRQSAHDTAARCLTDLVDLLDRLGKPGELAEAAEALSTELAKSGRYDAALAAAERALLVYRKNGDESRAHLVVARIGYLHFQRGTPQEGLARLAPTLTASRPDAAQLHIATAANLYQSTRYRESIEVSTQAIAIATRAGDDQSIGTAHLRRGLAHRLAGDRASALEDLHTAVSCAELAGDRDTVARGLTGIAVIHHYGGELSRTDSHFSRILRLAEELGDREVLSRAVCNYGASALWLGDWKRAMAQFNRALDLARTGGSPVCEATALISRGALLTMSGQCASATGDLELAISLGSGSDNFDLVRNANASLAESDLHQGRPDSAVARLLPVLDRPGQQEWQVTDLLPVLADAQLASGQLRPARDMADQATSRARDVGHALALVDALRVRALVSAQAERWSPAAADLDEALDLARTMGSPYLEARTRVARSRIAKARNALREAARERASAEELFTALRRDLARQVS